MFDLDKSIKEWLIQFSKHSAFDHGTVREMELHLYDHIDDLISQGHSEESAFKKAVVDFGEVPLMAHEEFRNKKSKTTLRSILFTTMYKNYTKASYRRLLKHPVSSVINLLGLAIAIGVSILVYSFGYWIENVDQHHINKDNVYLTTSFINRNGELQQWGISPRPLGEMMSNDFDQIDKVCRIQEQHAVVKLDDQVFHETVSFVDPAYLEMFTFPLLSGATSSLKDKSSIVLNADMAIKYFGDSDPIGRNLLLIFTDNKYEFTVTGVAEEFPDTHAVGFDFLLNYDNLTSIFNDFDPGDWTESISATLIQVDDPKNLAAIQAGMNKYQWLQNEAEEDWKIDSFKFEKLATLYQNSVDINQTISSPFYDTNKMAHSILTILAAFMLALASVNYINISIATASRRLKEIALRKTVGANRAMVISQYLTENLITTFLAMVLGVAFGKYILVPWFEYQNGYSSGFHFLDANLWLYLVMVLLLTALLSGLYPAIYISSFQAVKIFKGNVKFGKGSLVTKVFLGFQLILSTVLIVCAIMFTQNTSFLRQRSWGYDPDNILYAQVGDYTSYDKLRNSIEQYANASQISGSVDHIGVRKGLKVLNQQEKQFEITTLMVGPNYLNLMGLEVIDGRNFINTSRTADRYSLIVNERFVDQMSITEPVGTEYEIDTAKYSIVGVVKDFHFSSFSSDLEPMIFMLADQNDYRNLVFSINNDSGLEALNYLKKEWARLFPEIPFRGGLQEDVWGPYFSELDWYSEFWRMIAYVAVFMAALGRFGIVSLNISGRVREFSIKKILGAGLSNLGKNIAHDYLWLFAISVLIGMPVSYYLVGLFFDIVYPYHVPSNIESLIIAAVVLFSVLFAVISLLLVRVHKSNPVEGLKVE